jgi:hypothetical protein
MKIKKSNKSHLIRTITVYGSDFDFFMTNVSEISPVETKKSTDKKKNISPASVTERS